MTSSEERSFMNSLEEHVFVVRTHGQSTIKTYLPFPGTYEMYRSDPPDYERRKYVKIPYQPFGYLVFVEKPPAVGLDTERTKKKV